MISVEEFKKQITIDPNMLDQCCVEQPSIYLDICDAHAHSVSKRDFLYDQIKVIDAQTGLQVRDGFASKGVKFTEALVAAEVLSSDEHRNAMMEYNAAKLETDQYAALRDSFSQRSHMLRDLCNLYISGYWNDPSRGQSSEGVEDVSYQATKRKMKEKRKFKPRRKNGDASTSAERT